MIPLERSPCGSELGTGLTQMREGQPLRNKLQAGTICLGTFNTSSDPCMMELLCGSGYDFVIIDAEHGALNIETVQANIMAAKGSDTVPLIRVPEVDDGYIKTVLYAGAGVVLVPQINGVEDARRAVSACLYPPDGTRGFGPRRPSNYERNYPQVAASANDDIVVWVQLETMGAVEEIEEIVRVPNLTAVIIGPGDLAASLGLVLQREHPKILEAIEKVRSAATETGMPIGMAGTSDVEMAVRWLREGFQFVTLGNISGMLMRASRDFVSGVREGIERSS